MGFFEYYFSEFDMSKKENAVLCPFPHHTVSGLEYEESRPSAHVNTVDRLFHCKSCGTGDSELSFVSKLLGCTYENARKIIESFNTTTPVKMIEWLTLPKINEPWLIIESFTIASGPIYWGKDLVSSV